MVRACLSSFLCRPLKIKTQEIVYAMLEKSQVERRSILKEINLKNL